MKIHLVSRDDQLQKLCREILAALCGRDWNLTWTEPGRHPGAADLYIWDVDPDMTIPEDLISQGQHKGIYVVHRSHLAAVCDRLPCAIAGVLLKPVTQAALRAFLEHAVLCHEVPLEQRRGMNDRDDLLQCLLQANLRLQEYDQDRTNFLARALHDFRAPLTAASGYCGLLREQKLGPVNGDQIEVLRRMQHSIKRLSRIAAAMFQLSVGRQVKTAPELQPADIEACIEQALYEVMLSAEEKHIDIGVQLKCPDRTLYFEPGQIEQVLVNLLENACKFTPKHGSIEVRGYPLFWERRALQGNGWESRIDRRRIHSSEPNAFRVDICDSGPGIPIDHLDAIFAEYTSYSDGRDRSGGGLGLAICRMIVSAHEGKIWSESNGEGATFSFVLPLLDPKNGASSGAHGGLYVMPTRAGSQS